ncbi:hypothetical protein NDU88_006315 [Pleurodeles waltl]|uniref:Uncharacterized protein n=1 Tax=Pleurodeles waltl TaxID=8319 RepID=A0AAV7VPE2_PLEWA|nr:hypothetical protein NDU88_006315 [Pleurodeles waltl]
MSGARVGPSHPPACPAPMGPGPGVRRTWGSGAPGRALPDGPRPGCPGRLPRPGRALPRWAPAQVSGEASPAVPGVRGPGSGPAQMGSVPGVRGGFPGRPRGQGPRVGPCPDGPRPGCPGRLPRGSGARVGPCPDGPRPGCPADPGRPPRPSQGSGALGQALPRWAPAVPGVRGPGSGPAPMGPVPGVQGGFPRGPGGQGPRVGPCPDGPRPGCPGRLPQGSRGSGDPGRALQPALPRWAPAWVSGGGAWGSGAPGQALPACPAPMGPGRSPRDPVGSAGSSS